jgi:hypothetical protein
MREYYRKCRALRGYYLMRNKLCEMANRDNNCVNDGKPCKYTVYKVLTKFVKLREVKPK